MTGSILLALFAAWKTKNIANNFSDTSSVFYSIALQAQAWLVGVPTLALLGGDSADATYFGRVILIAVVSGSQVLVSIASNLPLIFLAL